ncbi:MAG TPA: hypothetical protein PLY75_02785, partial [Gammaproteobacteria bacterium]|nr:hypothetical protein [Gammaproteobacteria bacterium]
RGGPGLRWLFPVTRQQQGGSDQQQPNGGGGMDKAQLFIDLSASTDSIEYSGCDDHADKAKGTRISMIKLRSSDLL